MSWDTKYRPQKLADVVGQRDIVDSIRTNIKSGKLRHAVILSGIKGIGKTTTARLISKALNCLDPVEGDCCGTCKNCQMVASGGFYDLIEVNSAINTGVDSVRELISEAPVSPLIGKVKTYIMDEAHQLSTAAWNALLKDIEEPAAHTYWVLVTTEPHKIIPTILSRSIHYKFKPINQPTLESHLISIASAEGFEVEPSIISKLAEIANGSVREAIVNLEQICNNGRHNDFNAAMALVYVSNDALIDSIVASILNTDVGALIEAVVLTEAANEKETAVIQAILERVRNLFVIKLGQGQVTHEEVLRYTRFVTTAMEVVNNLDRYTNKKRVFEAGLLELAYV